MIGPWRSRCHAAVLAGLAGNALVNPTHTEVGHLTALLTGLACAPFVPNRGDAPLPGRLDGDAPRFAKPDLSGPFRSDPPLKPFR
jgi:hypothetical protein